MCDSWYFVPRHHGNPYSFPSHFCVQGTEEAVGKNWFALGELWQTAQLAWMSQQPVCKLQQDPRSVCTWASQKMCCNVWDLRDPAVSTLRIAVIFNSLFFCLHFQCSVSLITSGFLPITSWNASEVKGGKKKSNHGPNLRRKEASVMTSSYQKWYKIFLTKSFKSVTSSKIPHSHPY